MSHKARRVVCDLAYILLTVVAVKLAELTCRTLDDFFTITRIVRVPRVFEPLVSAQKRNEIVTFLNNSKRPRISAACEIGTGAGGTTYLLTKVAEPDAIIITLDLNNDWRRATVLNFLRRPRQELHVIAGDSRKLATLARIGKILGNRRLDLLFIDGDHSLNSVKNDFETYSMFVREGGWVAFHDIVPDYRTRLGIAGSGWTGDVPQYWRKVRRFWRSIEIVEAEGQDGYGIGLLEWAHAVETNSKQGS
jgi:predicted O-methyltransferase YrrM